MSKKTATESETNLFEKAKKEKPIKKPVVEWCFSTTVHGYSEIAAHESWFVKTMWILITVGSNAYMIVGLVQIIQAFLQYGVVVNYQSVVESPSDFPAITVCNLNPFDLTSHTTTGTYISNILMNNQISPNITVGSGSKSIFLVQQASKILKANVVADSSLNSSQLENLGFTLDTMLISCFYNDIECNSSDFTWVHSFDYGNCYTFNGDENNVKKTSRPGPTNGLRLELFVGVPGSQDFYTYKRGAYVVAHDPETKVPLFKYEGVTAKTGATTNIVVSRTYYNRLGSPYR
jgi:hypothetical protein